jgi:phenylacetate-coenzyme A ligase PaaK-like adenylate-forming protein
VRYEIGDEVELEEAAAATQIGVVSFRRVRGRCNDFVDLADGAVIHSEVFSHAIRPCEEIRGFQVVQSAGEIRIRYVSDTELAPAREGEIRNRLQRVHPDLAVTRFERVARLAHTVAGKTKMVVRE